MTRIAYADQLADRDFDRALGELGRSFGWPGSPQAVADMMARWSEERALDGDRISIDQLRRFMVEVLMRLCGRGLVRSESAAKSTTISDRKASIS